MNRASYVDPIIGTVGDEKQTSCHGGGKTHPGACYPSGMVQLSPDTTTSGDNGTGYNYCQNTIEGFSFNHMSGIGWYGDLGNVQVMPVVGKTDLRSGSNQEVPFTKGEQGWKSPFTHERETAHAGYHAVTLDRYDVFCEATVGCHAGLLRFTYPKSDESGIILNFARRIAGRAKMQSVEIEGKFLRGSIVCDHSLGGFGRGEGGIDYTLYFCMELSKAWKRARFFENEEFLPEGLTSHTGEDVHLRLDFDTEEGEQLLLRCGISYVDVAGAENNLRADCPDFDFDSAAKRATGAWEHALSCAVVEGEDQTDLCLFYTCLYHALLDPRTAVDVDGRYMDPTGNIQYATYAHRTMFSGWDVYRSEFPLLTLIAPKAVNDEINSLINIALAKNSTLPRWELMGIDSGCMVGDPGALVMADAYLKGIRDFDVEKAYEITRASTTCEKELFGEPFRNEHPESEQYKTNAYVPGQISETLEFLLCDYAMARLAEALGKTEDRDFFDARANRYAENFDTALGYMAPRDGNGAFLPITDEYDVTGCVESNIYQQTWFVPYDVKGLETLFGRERMLALLEKFFAEADFSALWNINYNHSNEPCHNITHYFDILGAPERTQYWTRRVQKEAYRRGAFGFCGNEDVGQLSAWYVLSALGLAQICMADDRYFLNTPLFRRATVRLDSKYHTRRVSDTLIVECDKDPLEYPFVESVTLNGVPLDRTYVTYSELTDGGILRFTLKKA